MQSIYVCTRLGHPSVVGHFGDGWTGEEGFVIQIGANIVIITIAIIILVIVIMVLVIIDTVIVIVIVTIDIIAIVIVIAINSKCSNQEVLICKQWNICG